MVRNKNLKKMFRFKRLAWLVGTSVVFAPLFLNLTTINQHASDLTTATLSNSDKTAKAVSQTFTKKIDLDMVDGLFNNEYYGVFDLKKYNADIRVYANQYVRTADFNDAGGVSNTNNSKNWLLLYAEDNKNAISLPNNLFSNSSIGDYNSKSAQWSIGFNYWLNQYADTNVFEDNFTNTSGGIGQTWGVNTTLGQDVSGGTIFKQALRDEAEGKYLEGVFQLHANVWSTQSSPWDQFAPTQVYFSNPTYKNANFQWLGQSWDIAQNQNMFYWNGRNKYWKFFNYTNGGEWRSVRIVMGLYDGKIWFVSDVNESKSSAILQWKLPEGHKVPLVNFLTMDSSKLSNYFNVILKNTPSNCYTSEPENLKIDLANDLDNRKVVATLTIPKSFVPGVGFNDDGNTSKYQWIETTDMTATIDLPYDDYFILGDVQDTALNTEIFTDTTDFYTYDVTNAGFVPTLNYSNIDEVKNDLLQAILSFWSSTLWINLPQMISFSDHATINIVEDVNNFVNGEVVIDELSLNTYYENNKLISSDSYKNFIQTDKPLKLTGLNRLPTEVNTTDTTLGLSVQDNVIVWDASNSEIFSDYTNTLPSEFDTSVIDDAQFFKDNDILINLPSEFDNATYSLVDKQANDIEGTLILKFNLNNFNNQFGSLQTEPKTFTIKFTGLKKADTTWNTNFLSDNTYTYALSPSDKLQNNIFSHITKEIIENAINDNIKFYLPTIKDGETLVVDSIELNQPDGAVTVNAHLQKDGVADITLPSLTITNFVFAPITPKTDTITSDLFPAEFLWSIANSYNEDYSNAVENDQATIIEKLSTLYDGLDASKYQVSIDINKCNANNLSGLLSLQLNVQYKESNAKINLVNSFTLSKTGVSQLAKTYYVDESKTSQALYEYLSDEGNANNFFADTTNGIVDTNSIPTLGNITYTISDLRITNKVITADVYVKNAISTTGYIPSFTTDNGYLLGTVTLVGNDYTSANSNPTVISQSNNYLTNDLFADVQTPSAFKAVVDANKNNQDFLKLLVNVINPTEGTQISIISDGEISANTIKYTFSVSPVIDDNGEISSTPLTDEYTYTLPHGDNVTIIHPLIDLNETKYAFEYTTEELLALNPVQGLPDGVEASISINEVNNFTRTITATLTAASYYNEQGELATNLERTITFINAKKVNGPTEVQRNNQPITESIDALKTALDNKNKDVIQKYITITDTGYTTPVTWEIASYVEVEGELGVFEVTINLTNYYFKNDNTLSFVDDHTTTAFVVKLGVIPTLTTQFDINKVDQKANNLYYYAANFNELAESNTTVINSSADITDETIKTLIPSLLENNPGISAADISFTRANDDQLNQIVLKNVTLSKYYDGSSTPATGTKNIGTLILIYKVTPNIVTANENLDPTTIPTTYDTYIDAQQALYASQLAYNFVNGDNALNTEIITAVKNTFLYYDGNQDYTDINITLKVSGSSGTSNINGGLNTSEYDTFMETGALPTNALNNAEFTSETVTTDTFNLKLTATLSASKDSEPIEKTVNVMFYNTLALTSSNEPTITNLDLAAADVNITNSSEVNASVLQTNLTTYLNETYNTANADLPIALEVNNYTFNEEGTLVVNVDVKNYNYISGENVLIRDLNNLTFNISGITIDSEGDINEIKTTILTSPITYTTTTNTDVNINELTQEQITSDLQAALVANVNNFENLPEEYSFEQATNHAIYKEHAVSGNNVVVSFYLLHYYENGQVMDNDDAANLTGPVFSATLTGYAVSSDLNINANLDLTGQAYNATNDTPAVDFKQSIKEQLVTAATNNQAILDYVNGTSFDPTISTPTNVVVSEAKVSGIISVTDSTLATLTGDSTWNSGFIFSFANATWNTTTVTVKDASLTTNMTFEEFKTNPEAIAIDELLTIENLPAEATATLKAGMGDNAQGIGQIVVVFSQFYDAIGNTLENYEYVIEQNFTFTPGSSDTTISNVLKTTMTAAELGVSGNAYSLLKDLTSANASAINTQLNANKNLFIADDHSEEVEDLTLSFVYAQVDQENNTTILLTLSVNEQLTQTISVTAFATINPTVFSETGTLPSDLKFANVSDYFVGDSATLTTKIQQLVTWNDQVLPDGLNTVVEKVVVFNVANNSAKLNIEFNGVYNNNGQYVQNYYLQLDLSFDASGTLIKTVINHIDDVLINNSASKNDNWWIWVLVAVSSLAILLGVMYAIFCTKKGGKR